MKGESGIGKYISYKKQGGKHKMAMAAASESLDSFIEVARGCEFVFPATTNEHNGPPSQR